MTMLRPLLRRWLALALSLPAVLLPATELLPAYRDPARPTEARVADLLSRLTLDEKLLLVDGDAVFNTRPIPRLGLPALIMADGPLGVRNFGPSTAYPAGPALAASWDTELARAFGESLGRDCRARGVHLLLGPGINIERVPVNGRNFEYFSEDPHLAARLAVAEVQGLQSQGVAATVKHFACNNQETWRDTVDVRVSERALREIYLPAFQAAVTEGGAWAVMCAYNRLNGPYASASDWLNHRVLKAEWGFRGVLMSDWGATHDTADAFLGGLDLEMPGGEHFTPEKLRALLAAGRITVTALDDKVSRILRLAIANGFLDRPQKVDGLPLDDPASAACALQIAREGIVLLRNDGGVLPLDREKVRSVIVTGPLADQLAAGDGSSLVKPFHAVTAFAGLRAIAGPGVTVSHLPVLPDSRAQRLLPGTVFAGPLKEEFYRDFSFDHPPVAVRSTERIDYRWEQEPVPGLGPRYLVRWTGNIVVPADGEYTFAVESDDGSNVYLDDRLIINNWLVHKPLTKVTHLRLEGGRTHRLRVEYFQYDGEGMVRFGWGPRQGDATLPAAQAAALRAADAVIYCAGFRTQEEGEGFDHESELPDDQAGAIRQVVAANPRTVVVLHTGTRPETASWVGGVRALLHAWYPGQEGGRALAEILFGDVNPSGRLPVSFEARTEDWAARGNYPGKDGRVDYAEDIFVGYRWLDRQGLTPLFPFGHGLSYTSFRYDDLKVALEPDGRATVSVRLTNTGPRAGAEVAQVYVSAPAGSLPRPVRELKGFARVTLAAGESRTVTVTLDRQAFAYFDPAAGAWRSSPGRHVVAVGASSRDLRCSADLQLP